MSKWELTKKPELIQVPIDPKIYQKKLLAIARALYCTLTCQLDSKSIAFSTGLQVSRIERVTRRPHE